MTPPATRDERRDWLRLIRSRRIGPVTFWRLMADHGSAAAVLAALPGIAAASGAGGYAACSVDDAEREIAAGHAAGARPLFFGATDYPAALADLADAPPLLWAIGDPALATLPMVAMVGARNASSLGQRMARKLAEGLAEAGYCVVSGLARGIDACAHQAVLDAGGATLAVQAGGVDVIYPAENARLAARLATDGLRLSEQPMGLEPQARHFPLRNRIISGLSRAVVVVEAASRSGSLITARTALDQGREVLAVPGHPFDARASGCNMLIRDGATLVRGTDDILDVIGSGREAGRAEGKAEGNAAPSGPGSVHRGDKAAEARRAPAGAARRAGVPHLHAPPPSYPPSVTATAATGRAPRAAAARADHTSPARTAEDFPPVDTADIADIGGMILDLLGPSPVAEDQVLRDLALPAAMMARALLALELDGVVIRHAGGLLSRT